MSHHTRLALPLVVALTVTACGGAPAVQRPDDGRAVSIASCGQSYVAERTPSRVVTLDQSSTETLLALGVGDRLVGTSNLKTKIAPAYQADYQRIPVLSPKTLTGEQLRAATPDLVVASFTDLFTRERVGTRAELGELGLPSYVSTVDCPSTPNADPFESLFADYENLGRILAAGDRAAALISEQRAIVADSRRAASTVTGTPSVVWLYSVAGGLPYVAGGTSLPSAMSRATGTRNVFDDIAQDWPEVTWERIAERDPDVIVLGDLSERGRPGDSAADKIAMLRADPVLSKTRAVTGDRFIQVPGIEMDPSVRSVNALRLFVDGLRGLGHVR